MNGAIDLLEECSLLKIDDLLPWFPDLKGEMMTYTSSAEKIRNEIQALKGRRGEIQGNQVCELCDQAILSRVFYLFPCSHAFHADCLTREVGACGGFEA